MKSERRENLVTSRNVEGGEGRSGEDTSKDERKKGNMVRRCIRFTYPCLEREEIRGEAVLSPLCSQIVNF